MEVFLYYKYKISAMTREKKCFDFAVFLGRHLDKRKNQKFKMERVLLSISGDCVSGEVLNIPEAKFFYVIEEVEKVSEVYHRIIL
jgi:hypothetical protein